MDRQGLGLVADGVGGPTLIGAQDSERAGDAGPVADLLEDRQFAALLPVIERVSRAEHPSTLTARAELAYWTGQADSQAEH